MDYGSIVNRSFQIAWKYKTLWIFGLFTGAGSGSYNFPGGDETSALKDIGIDIPPEAIFALVIPLVALALVALVAHLISMPALVDAVNRIARGGKYTFGESFSAGLKYFWRYLGLTVLMIVIIFIAMMILVILGAAMFAIAKPMGILSLLALIPAGIATLYYVITVFELALRALVVRDYSIGDALEEGRLLVNKNIWKTIVMFLITIGLGILLMLASMIVWLMFSGPIALITALGTGDVLLTILATIVAGLPIALILGGFTGTVFESMYTLFYFELLEPGVAAGGNTPPPPAPDQPFSGAEPLT